MDKRRGRRSNELGKMRCQGAPSCCFPHLPERVRTPYPPPREGAAGWPRAKLRLRVDNPYDELPYRSVPVEWMAPERLALASLVHGGPRTPLDRYRMLELGCGDGTNLVALAYYRRHAEFVGVDGSSQHIEAARERVRALGLDNVRFVHADLRELATALDGRFEYIAAHGVLSWVPDDVRDAVLALPRECSAPGGIVYLNYNALPGWRIRGLVRELLLAQTAGITALRARTEAAQRTAARLAERIAAAEPAWSQLLAGELRIVARSEASYVAHEYLAPDNHAYWRSEFTALARTHGLEVVCDADFAHAGGRVDLVLDAWLADEGLVGRELGDTADLIRYRQLHSPVLAISPWTRCPPDVAELGALWVASSLVPDGGDPRWFHHPRGEKVTVDNAPIVGALERLLPHWPRGLRVRDVLPDVAAASTDLLELHRYGVIELRCVEPDDFLDEPVNRLHALELAERGEITTAHHRRVAAP